MIWSLLLTIFLKMSLKETRVASLIIDYCISLEGLIQVPGNIESKL